MTRQLQGVPAANDPKSAVNQILHSILTSTAMPQFVTVELLRRHTGQERRSPLRLQQSGGQVILSG
ncbi:MAG: hypothetical protein V3T83_21715 [Acidobacteriota bacterium]